MHLAGANLWHSKPNREDWPKSVDMSALVEGRARIWGSERAMMAGEEDDREILGLGDEIFTQEVMNP